MENMGNNTGYIEAVYTNFNNVEQKMLSDIKLCSTHPVISGNYKEDMWGELFSQLIPEKFSMICNVVLVDSYGNCSNEIDIAFVDRQYTPYVFNHGNIRFVPIEAVAVVIESKSSKWDKIKLSEWAESIYTLKSVSGGVARMANGLVSGTSIQTRTMPLLILASNKKVNEMHESNTVRKYFDIIITCNNNMTGFNLDIPYENMCLSCWTERLNSFQNSNYMIYNGLKKCCDYSENKIQKSNEDNPKDDFKYQKLSDLRVRDNILLSLNLQLNQLLMLINNPMLFPHFAYAKRFNEIAIKKD